ncbi:MAG: hypothetical protein RDV48_07135 [Candidatus Eremiobacteraeota bacterium]|nr:hypothetical protein [Candidatus Eremiobacteraeota bacterium]
MDIRFHGDFKISIKPLINNSIFFVNIQWILVVGTKDKINRWISEGSFRMSERSGWDTKPPKRLSGYGWLQWHGVLICLPLDIYLLQYLKYYIDTILHIGGTIMALKPVTHRENCMCPACRSSRGEKWATKKRFTTSINPLLIDHMQSWARLHNTSLAGASEKALTDFLEREQQAHFLDFALQVKGPLAPEQAEKIKRLLGKLPDEQGIRIYRDEEIDEWKEADRLPPELKEKLEAMKKLPIEEQRALFNGLAERLQKDWNKK